MKLTFITLYLGALSTVGLTAPSETEFERQVLSGRRSIQPFAGLYKLTIKYSGTSRPPVQPIPGKVTRSVGYSDSEEMLICSAGPDYGYVKRIGKSETNSGVFNSADTSMTVWTKNGKVNASFGKGKVGSLNVPYQGFLNAAIANYWISTKDIILLENKLSIEIVRDSTAEVSVGGNRYTLSYLRQAKGIDWHLCSNRTVAAPGPKNGYECRIVEYLTYRGHRYPKHVVEEQTENGKVIRIRTYTLVKVLNPSQYVEGKFIEGARIQDTETQIVYDFINGRLVPNERFNRGRNIARTWKSAAAICITSLCAWATFRWVKARTRRKDQPTEETTELETS